MPQPFHQDPSNDTWPIPLPGPYDPNAPRVPGTTTTGPTGGESGGGVPIPSRPISPIGGMPPAISSWTAAGAENGGGILGWLSRLAPGTTNWADVFRRLLPVIGVTGLTALMNRGQSNDLPPEMRDILNLQKQRMEAQGPLYASILRLAQSRLPTSVQGAQLPAGSGPSRSAVEELARRRQP